MSIQLPIPGLVGGVSDIAPSQRPPHFVEEADNINISETNGLSDRPGTEFIGGEKDSGALDTTGSLERDEIKLGWIDRDEGEQFLYLIAPGLGDADADIVQVFDLDGNKRTVTYDGDVREYLAANAAQGDARRRLRGLSIADATMLLNRTVLTDPVDGQITYKNGDGDLRQRANPKNVESWDSFDHPPTDTRDLDADPIPDSGDVTDEALWFAREDTPGWPQGFYAAVSETQPPWFERIRTEGANSRINDLSMPVKLFFDGTDFELRKSDWRDRFAGDSTTNPLPGFFGNAISDMLFFQNRLFFGSGEILSTSQSKQLFDLWRRSEFQVDSDPIDIQIPLNRVVNIDHMIPYRDSLLLLTNGARQLELRADGFYGPNSIAWHPTSSVSTVDYVNPVAMGNQVYFMGERNFAMTVYEYFTDQMGENRAKEITEHIGEYIPASATQMEASESHNKLFVLTDAVPNAVYVAEIRSRPGEASVAAWYRWTFGENTEVLSIQTFDDYLYMAVKRGDELFLERIHIDVAPQDVAGDPLQTMGYSVRLDRKQLLQGVFDEDSGTTSWTLPFEDEHANEIVLGPTWDVDVGGQSQRLAGTRLTPEVTIEDNQTVLTVEGQYATNLADEEAPAYVGRPRDAMRVRLSRPILVDQNGNTPHGNLQILSGKLRFRKTGYFRVEITPEKRETRQVEYLFPRVGSTPLDGEFLHDGEQFFRVLASDAAVIEIINDSPLPCNLISGEYQVKFTPNRKSPT